MGLCAIGFYLIRRSIIKQIKREVTAETDDIYDSVERLFGDLDELVEQIETTEMDDDLVLLQKRDLLISFAQEVGYPRYENDVNLTNQIIDNHFFKKYPPEQTTILIKNMEQLMLDKAYKFYTGRLGRKRHLRGKLLWKAEILSC